jgi:predicted transcriptional regulator of viral defense system
MYNLESRRQPGVERSLSRNEARLILDLEWRGKRSISLTELQAALGISDAYARYLAHRLVKKGWLERLRPGLFHLISADRGVEGVADTHPLAVGLALPDRSFFSFGTACTHHGFTEQVFSEVYVAAVGRPRSLVIRGKRYVLVPMSEDRFFGFEETPVLGQPVQMATRERTLLDALDRPRYAGGIGEVSRIVRRAATQVSWTRLIRLLRRWDESALVQRLGYLLELNGVELPIETRDRLHRLVRPRVKVHLGSRRQWGSRGRLDRTWNVIENVPRDVLIEKGESKARRVVFEKARTRR